MSEEDVSKGEGVPQENVSDLMKAAAAQVTKDKNESAMETSKALREVADEVLQEGRKAESAEAENEVPAENRRRRSSIDSLSFQKLYAEPAAKTEKRRERRFSLEESRERLSRRTPRKTGNNKKQCNDEMECIFQPKINRKSKEMVRNSGAFMKRFQASHETKTMTLELRRAQQEYEAKLNKKMCPSCKAEQSFEESRTHRNKCRDCKIPFRHKLLWQDVQESFLQRAESKIREKEEKLADLVFRSTPRFRPSTAIPVEWKQVESSFMDRMEYDMKRREMKKILTKREAMEECTFKPNLVSQQFSHETSFPDGSFEDRMEQDFIRRQRERTRPKLRTQDRLFDPAVGFKKAAAWDETPIKFSGGHRRRPSNKWL